MRQAWVGAILIGVPLAAAPSFAQNTARSLTTSITQGKPLAAPGGIELTRGGWRGTQIIGARVYNDDEKAIGTIDDLLVDTAGHPTYAILSVGGFLGIDSKLVKVPYDHLKFVTAGGPTAHILLPDTPRDALSAMPAFRYTG